MLIHLIQILKSNHYSQLFPESFPFRSYAKDNISVSINSLSKKKKPKLEDFSGNYSSIVLQKKQ